jgi:hypothetical protein
VAAPAAARPSTARVRAALERYLQDVKTRPGQEAPGAHASKAGLTQTSYYNWAGYADDNGTSKTYTSVAGTWKQNKVTCPKDEDRIAVWWIGLDGFNNNTVEQDGTLAWCLHGTATYYSWWEMFPTNNIQIVGSSVAPGDKIVASVKFAAGNYTLTLTDSTHPANSFTKVEQCAVGQTCANASAEWIAEAVGTNRGYQPWPSFGTWKLTGAKVTGSGTQGTISSFPDDEITMIGSNLATALGTPSALNPAGNSFTVKWNYAWA